MIAIHVIWTLLLLVSTSLVAKVVTTLNLKFGGTSSCDDYDKADADIQCGQLIAGVVSIYKPMNCSKSK